MSEQELLAGLIENLRQKTGVEVYLSPRGGEETPFTVAWGNGNITLYTQGTDETAKTSARLLAFLFSETSGLPDKTEQLRAVLLGDRRQAEQFALRFGIGAGPWCAFDVSVDKHCKEAMEHIESCLEEEGMALFSREGHIAVLRKCGGEQTSYEFAQFLNQSLYEEMGIRACIGVGGEAEFSSVSASYAQAMSALRMSALFRERGEVHSYREYLLVRMIESVPRETLEEFARRFFPAGAEEIFEDEVMAQTAEEFLRSNLNVSEASRNLYMHRNTLLYRLDKIENVTGLNLRKFSDAVTFRMLTILRKLLAA